MEGKPPGKSQSPESCGPSSATASQSSGRSTPTVRRSDLQFRTHAIRVPAMKGKFAKGFHTTKEFHIDSGWEIHTDYTRPAYDPEPEVESTPEPSPPRPMTGLALVNYKTSPENTGAVEKRKSGHRQMDYYTALDDSIEHLKSSPKSSSPNKTFWEGTGAIPKYFSKDYKTPSPKVLPPFHRPSPTKSKMKTVEFTPDIKDRVLTSPKSDGSSKLSSPGSAQSETSSEVSSPKAVLSEESSPKSAQSDEAIEQSSPKSVQSEKLAQEDEASFQPSPKSTLETPSKSFSSIPSKHDESMETFRLKLQPDELNEQSSSQSASLKYFELGQEANASALDLPSSKTAEPVDDSNVPSKLSSVEASQPGTSKLEFEDPVDGSASSLNSTKPIPNLNTPKKRSDFKDDSQWVRYNCLDFQDYKRTVNNKQKGVEQSINQVLPSMNRAMKDAQRLAVKIDKVRSEVCDKEDSLKIQNDKLKYLVGRTMSTLGKIDEVLDRFRTDILAYTTLTTEGNEGIDMRLSRLLKVLCGLDEAQLAREKNSLIREAFSEDVTEGARDYSES